MYQPNYFKIILINGRVHDTSYGGYPWRIDVVVELNVKDWQLYRKKKMLGQMYGVDFSNAVYHINNNIPASCPMVDDRKRAKNGIKTINLTYFLRDADRAENLGFEVYRHPSGETSPGFADYVSIYREEK